MARQGKIARLPDFIRQQLNARIHNGEPGSVILPWLNGLPSVVKIMEAHFEGNAVTDQNLSEWRAGGFADWLAKREKIDALKSLSSHCLKLAEAGTGMTGGLAAIAAGRIMDALENAGDGEDGPDLESLVASLSRLRSLDLQEAKLKLDARRSQQKDSEIALAQEKFQRQTIEYFLKWAKRPEARSILESGKPKQYQASLLRELIFGKAEGDDS